MFFLILIVCFRNYISFLLYFSRLYIIEILGIFSYFCWFFFFYYSNYEFCTFFFQFVCLFVFPYWFVRDFRYVQYYVLFFFFYFQYFLLMCDLFLTLILVTLLNRFLKFLCSQIYQYFFLIFCFFALPQKSFSMINLSYILLIFYNF